MLLPIACATQSPRILLPIKSEEKHIFKDLEINPLKHRSPNGGRSLAWQAPALPLLAAQHPAARANRTACFSDRLGIGSHRGTRGQQSRQRGKLGHHFHRRTPVRVAQFRDHLAATAEDDFGGSE